jgi:hypothetical protein
MFVGNDSAFQASWMASAVPIAVACGIEEANTSICGKNAASKFMYTELLLNPPSTKILFTDVPRIIN